MKRALIYTLSLAITLSLVACGRNQADQQISEPDPATASSQADASTPEPDQKPTDLDTPSEQEPKPQPVSMEPATPALDEGEGVKDDTGVSGEVFTDCNETVYATGTVNLRSDASTESEKVGSLSKGQSVTRIGIGIVGGEADGWSKIQLADGVEVYVSSKYLSTTKPEVQTSNTGGNSGKQETSKVETPAPAVETPAPAPAPAPAEQQTQQPTSPQSQISEAERKLAEERRQKILEAGGFIDENGTIYSGDSGDYLDGFKLG